MVQVTKKQENNKIVLTIEVPFSDYEKHIRHAASHISEHVDIKGFRPGNAPYDMVVARVGEMSVYQEAMDDIIQETYMQEIQKQDIKEKVYFEPEIKIEKLAPGNPIVYTAELMMVPEVKLGKYKDLKIKNEKLDKNSDDFKKKVEKVFDDLKRRNSTEVIADKIVEEGDKIVLNIELLLNGVPLEDGFIKDYPLVIEEKFQFIEGFNNEVKGLKKGEQKEFELLYPENAPEKKLAGKKVLFKVDIKEVYKIERPEFNDEFAKKLGAESIEKLTQQIEENIEHEESHKNEDKVTIEMLEEIVKGSKIGEVPERLIKLEQKKMVEELKNNVVQNGMDFEKYKEAINKTEENLEEEFKEKATERIKLSLVVDEISKDEKIEVADEEVDKEIEDAKKYYANHADFENILKNLEHPGYRTQLEKVIKNEKVLKFLREKNLV